MKHLITALLLFNTYTSRSGNYIYTMNSHLNKQEQQLAAIAATTAIGKVNALKTALSAGLDVGLTINQINEVLAQMYAYAGFPRSLTGINIFMAIVEERKAKGIIDQAGETPKPIDESGDKYERGRNVLELLTKQPQSKPAKGFGDFNPTIDKFLKEHLFADIFDSDVLTYRQRELATIAALASLPGVDPMLQSHINMGMNVGLTEPEIFDLFTVIETTIDKATADHARSIYEPNTTQNMEPTKNDNEINIFPKGEKGPAAYFTGTPWVQILVPKDETGAYSIGSVTFEPGARTNWHTHPAGQILLVTDGDGFYQEKGKPARTLKKGDVINIPSGVEHWHGASKDHRLVHIAISNFKDESNVTWLSPVTDEEYNSVAQ